MQGAAALERLPASGCEVAGLLPRAEARRDARSALDDGRQETGRL
jgi:hypothetical protein